MSYKRGRKNEYWRKKINLPINLPHIKTNQVERPVRRPHHHHRGAKSTPSARPPTQPVPLRKEDALDVLHGWIVRHALARLEQRVYLVDEDDGGGQLLGQAEHGGHQLVAFTHELVSAQMEGRWSVEGREIER